MLSGSLFFPCVEVIFHLLIFVKLEDITLILHIVMLTGTNYNGIRNCSAASHFIYALLVKSIIPNNICSTGTKVVNLSLTNGSFSLDQGSDS